MDVGVYHILKEKDAISFTRVDEDTVKYCIKQFDPLTGESMEDVVDEITNEMVNGNIKTVNSQIEYLNQSMANLITLKEDLEKAK